MFRTPAHDPARRPAVGKRPPSRPGRDGAAARGPAPGGNPLSLSLATRLPTPVRRRLPGTALQRQPAEAEPEAEAPSGPPIKYLGQKDDLQVADGAVRDFFGALITGPPVQPWQFKMVEEEKFAAALPNSREALPDLLLGIFLNPDAEGEINQILRHHGVAMKVRRDPVKALKAFIKERIEAGFFEFTVSLVAADEKTNVIRLTPEALVARFVKGVTETGPKQRGRRRIVVQQSQMSTLVHEIVHFYTHPGYQAEVARRAAGKHFMGAQLNETLIEGVTEHLARKVMWAREKQLGALGADAYAGYTAAVDLLAEVTGEHTLRLAFFQGDREAIARLFRNVEIFNGLLEEGNFSPEKIVEIHHLHDPLAASWFR